MQSVRYVRVVHPHHPLAGQIVKVVRRAGHPTDGARGWVIELPDGTRARLPPAWAVAVYDTTDAPPSVPLPPDGLWADVTRLRALATLVQSLLSSLSTEVTAHDASDPSHLGPKAGGCPTGFILADEELPPSSLLEQAWRY